MVLTVCYECDKSYGGRQDACPHCGCHNFFSDEDIYIEAVHYLCEDLHANTKKEKEEKLKELRSVRWWQNPPWWMRWLIWFYK